MDRHAVWPWSWEEETEWKAELQERDYDFVEDLIEDAVGESTVDAGYSLGVEYEDESSGERAPDKYLVVT